MAEYQRETAAGDVIEMVPILPLRDVVVYPYMAVPLFVGREKSVRALEAAMRDDKQIMLVTQKAAENEDPGTADIYHVGTLATILQLLKLPDGTIKVLVEGELRAKVLHFIEDDDYLKGDLKVLKPYSSEDAKKLEAASRSLFGQFEHYVKLNKKVPAELLQSLAGIEDPGRLADSIAAHMSLKIDEKQKLLEIADEYRRLEHILSLVAEELDVLQIEKKIRNRVQKQMEKSQREYYLNEQMKAVQQELGELDNVPNETEEYRAKIKKAGMPAEVRKKADAEVNKLSMMTPMSAEATVVRNYLDWLVGLPWKKKSKIKKDLHAAEQILEEDHYGLDKVKERILEYLAVNQRARTIKGPILCLTGPPGVGKTSLGRSIARATGRKFSRMALGGVRDEAEIRGHRRTYVGALPGKLIQNLSKAGVRNPLFLLDEVDKMSMDFRGDPASALLEVLDPEQNHTFADHYLEVEFDLSDVMFVCTANSLNIPPPLLDRMEVIRLPGYTEDEKLNIASRYLIPKQTGDSGLAEKEIAFSPAAIRSIIRYYTREAGVRGLEREIAKICRKVVKSLLMNRHKDKDAVKTVHIQPRSLEKYLGVRKHRYGVAEEEDRIGQVNGLAWTEVGGELLTVEAAIMTGKGKLTHTGQLGDVMQESVRAAMTVVRSRTDALGIQPDFYETRDIHVHVPEGATPKDGPSAGVAMCTAIASALTKIPVRSDVAMTGEITLRGEVLAIGGLKEKLLAALRARVQTVLIPQENKKDLKEIPSNILNKLDIRPVRWIDEVLEAALTEAPSPADFSGEGEPLDDASSKKIPAKSSRSTEIQRH